MSSKKTLKIQRLDPIEHILKRPDTYVGSVRTKIYDEYVSDCKEITRKKISFSPAILRIFIEALSNAIDNVQRSIEVGTPCTKIKISIDQETGETRIWNDGRIIEVEQDPLLENKYKHTLIFGELRTSTNFDDSEDRTVSGRNGLGIKLTNVFSKTFKVNALDPTRGLHFAQEWSNNMRNVSPPKITKSSLKTGYTEIIWTPDFEFFGIPGYTTDIINLYTRYVIDCAMLTKVNVYFNNEKLPIKSLQDYAKLFSSPTSESVYIRSTDSEVVVTSAKEFEFISFVNGIFTVDGGTHVEAWSEAVFRPIVDHLNKPKKPQVNIKDVKQFYRIFVVSTLINPEFSSQSKTLLTAPDVKAKVDPKTTKSMLKWESIDKITDIIRGKELLVMKKSESKKRGVAIGGYEEANEAGGKHSLECTLALCEGLSAKTFAVKGMESMLFGKSGRDWFGVYALRGKILNVRNANSKSIAENREITAVIQILNLKYGVDYRIDENFAQLNYGKLLILTDADTDGKHIAGLIINFIHFLFPTLLERTNPSFLVDMMTPIAKFTMRNEMKIFYSAMKADAYYKENIKTTNIHIQYYKGLGSHSDQEIVEEFGKKVISYLKDENTDKNMIKAFHSKSADDRKKWIENYNPSSFTEPSDTKTISDFIDEDLITHSIDNCGRSIPSIMDGLKQSQRKILYACFLKNLTKSTLKVSQLSGYVAEKTNYHHGEENLYDTITKMANEFVGSNNIPLLFREGQFGSRSECGKDAANARYIKTRLEHICRYLFRDEDDDLTEKVIDDGDIVEPVFYVPILPMILINGTEGIGTGWACSVPCHDPLDIIECVKTWIESDNAVSIDDNGIVMSSLPEIKPWYRDFRGTIVKSGENKYTSYGVCERNDVKNRVVITEVPVGTSITSVKEQLEEWSSNGKDSIIKGYKNYSTANNAHFIIEEFSDGLICTPENLKLYSYISLNNMVMTDENGKIKKYNSVDEIINNFCKVRLYYYHLRKENLLKIKRREMIVMTMKKRFLEEVMDGIIILNRKKEDVITSELESGKYEKIDDSYGYLLRLPIKSFTEEKVAELLDDIFKLEKEISTLMSISEKTMWLNDIEEFKNKYLEWLNDIIKYTKKIIEPAKKKVVRKNK